jgi:hypothetical protein
MCSFGYQHNNNYLTSWYFDFNALESIFTKSKSINLKATHNTVRFDEELAIELDGYEIQKAKRKLIWLSII